MPRKHLIQIDKTTGEQIEGTIVHVHNKSHGIYGGDWFMSSREANASLAKEPELTERTFRILHFLLSKLDFENWIQINQKEIVEDLGLHKSNVSREISLLVKKKILLRGSKVGQSHAFRLNPYYAWRGDSKKGKQWIGKIVQGGKE